MSTRTGQWLGPMRGRDTENHGIQGSTEGRGLERLGHEQRFQDEVQACLGVVCSFYI